MFETCNQAKVIVPEELRDPEEHAWWYVKLRLHAPWFYVTVEKDCGDDATLTQMLLITQVEHLVEANSSKSIKIRHVYLVIPGHMNGGDEWKMSPLSEIWVGREPETESYQEAYIFILEDGKHYVLSDVDTEKNDLLDITKVFP